MTPADKLTATAKEVKDGSLLDFILIDTPFDALLNAAEVVFDAFLDKLRACQGLRSFVLAGSGLKEEALERVIDALVEHAVVEYADLRHNSFDRATNLKFAARLMQREVRAPLSRSSKLVAR
jgi:hypothetical protein